jgi:hypothetical protein
MPVGTVQLFDQCMGLLLDGSPTWIWETGPFAGTLWDQAGADPADTLVDFTGLDATHNEVTGGGYAQQQLGSLTVTVATGVVQFHTAIVNFGTNVTITTKYLVCIQGTVTVSGTADTMWFLDLDTTSSSSEVSSVSSDFTVDDAATGWWTVNKQA